MSGHFIAGTLVSGCIYAMVVIGMVILFRSTQVISFTQGSYMALGAYIFSSLLKTQGFAWSFLEVLIVMAMVGGLSYKLLFSRLAGAGHFVIIIATLGLDIVILTVIGLIWGPEMQMLPNPLGTSPIRLFEGRLTFTPTDLFTVVLAFVLIVVLILTLQKTLIGLQMRAVSDSPLLALYLGVSVDRVAILAWAIGALTAGAAGIVLALGSTLEAGPISSLGLVAFPAMILGGLDSILGALVGGLGLALVQNVVAANFGGEWTDIVAYSVLILVLLARPAGLFGSKSVERI